uniref:Odorant receptor n=1 Tax=Mythimna separata TaxID=271217 RepID=A0A7H1DH96_MYTSE|nr:olfactory receptor 25 [Mythimna separata]
MGLVKNLWRKLTHTKALDQSSGRLETVFFESIYRIAYVTGMSTSDHGILYLIYSNMVKLMIVLLVCGEVWFGFTRTSSLDEVAASINATVIQFITIYRYKNMMAHKDFYKKLASSMESPYFDISTEERKKLVDFWYQTNERYLKLLLALGNCTLAAWFIFPLLDDVEYNLIVGIRLPFYYMTPERYPLAYTIVVISFFYISHFVMVTDLKMQTHLMHLLCQFTVLADCFENLLRDCRPGFEDVAENNLVYNKSFADKYTKRLGELVQQHKLILSHTMNMRDTLSGPMLGQLAASGTLICFIGYQATTTLDDIAKCLMSCLFLGYNLFDFYIICRWCEEITNQSAKVGEAIYCSGWECGLSKLPGVRSTILFVIARANRPLVLTAGGMYDLSLTSYTTLVKTSYSALTVLLRFRHD